MLMTIYLTGSTGFVGSNFLRVTSELYDTSVFAALNKTGLKPRPNLTMATVKLVDPHAVRASVREVKPDALVHMAFFNDLTLAYRDRKAAWRVMVDATKYLLEAARELNIPFVFVSTDWVFDGTQGIADESTPPNPINYYGVMKVVAETLVTQYSKGAVARIAGVFGLHWEQDNWTALQNTGFGNLPVATVQALQKGQPFDLWMQGEHLNRYATPTLATDACEMMLKIIKQGAAGIFHCCGAEGLSRQEVVQRTAKAFGFDSGLIREAGINAHQPMGWQGIPIPSDTRLDGTHTAKVLKHPQLIFEESLAKLKIQMETGALA
jgi:dTDP-4-dehydrorhamnose reductase